MQVVQAFIDRPFARGWRYVVRAVDRRRRSPPNLVVVFAALLAFVASVLQATPIAIAASAAAKIDGARSKPDAMVDRQVRAAEIPAAKPPAREPDRGSGPLAARDFAVNARLALREAVRPKVAPPLPFVTIASSRARAQLMVFLN